jgi:phage FluMu gp28-like protein
VYSQAEIGFRRMKARLPKEIFKPNQSNLTLTFKNGARMQFRSGERSDDLYGDDVYAVVIDEASRMREESWHAIRSTLTKTQGRVRIIGNVRGRKNWFYQLARVAEAGTESDMAYHKLTAYDAIDAGVLAREEIESAKRHFSQLGQDGVFRQLYLAEAAEDGDNPFGLTAIEACVVENLSRETSLVAGVDLAGRGAVNVNQTGDPLSRDWTAIVMLDREGYATHIDRFRKPHTETAMNIAVTVGRTMALVDSTGAGDPVVETLQRRGDMRVEGYTYTERSRQDLLEGLALAIGEGAVHFPDGPLRRELDSFEFRYARRGVSYAVPAGMHDDLAMALALAVKKMPWRRKHSTAPVGILRPGGSTWTGAGGDDSAWQRYQDSLKPSQKGIGTEVKSFDELDIPPEARPPTVITGPGAGKWTGRL